jgi:predicted amino acid racemase
MFLKSLIQRNPAFLQKAVELHQTNQIPPNSYVLDLDTIKANAAWITNKAASLGLKVFAMTKQIGRNPEVLKVLTEVGVNGYVAVDMACAHPIHYHGHAIGHLGHLVQIPRAEALAAAKMKPAYWTVFSMHKAREAAAASLAEGHTQALLARIHAPGDTFYSGHEGGFQAEEITAIADQLNHLSGAAFAGITTFPALLFDLEKQEIVPTPNLRTLEISRQLLAKAGCDSIEINAPGTTSSVVLEYLANAGATQVEPGHGLTGTTPLHAVRELPENPAMLYLSEVSHFYHGNPYCFGGGLYVDPVFPAYDIQALVGSDPDLILKNIVSCQIPPAEAIDYYGILREESTRPIHAGDTVIFGFRAQAFVTRAFMVPVSGIHAGMPKVEGIWTTDGRSVSWPEWKY